MLTRHRPAILGVLVCLLALLPAVSARADVIVARPLAPTAGGEYSNLGATHQQVADSFDLTAPVTLTSLAWYGRYDSLVSTSPVDFVVRLFTTESGGAPAITPTWSWSGQAAAADTGQTFVAWTQTTVPWLRYSITLPGWTIATGTYWLSIVESDESTPPDTHYLQWLWADTTTSGLVGIRNGDGLDWLRLDVSDVHHAFTLEGTTVPEPASLLLFGSGVLSLVLRRRRT